MVICSRFFSLAVLAGGIYRMYGPANQISTSLSFVRNMGNFNLFQTHVLMIFHHVEQCYYPSFLLVPHIPAMTSHVAYVIYATFTLITTQGLCNITFSPYVFLSSMHLGPYFFLCSSPLFSFHIHVALLTLYRIRNQVYLSTRNRSRLNVILEGFLKTT